MIARRVMLAVFVLAALATFVLVLVPAGRAALGEAVAWLRAAGWTGRALAVALVVVGIPLGLPTLWLAALLGYLFGAVSGLAIAWPATILGGAAAFALARGLLADDVAAFLARRPRWRAVAGAVNRGGVRLVVLLRLAAPHNLLNLVFAASTLPMRSFLLGTALGSLPTVALATLGGALAPDAAALFAR